MHSSRVRLLVPAIIALGLPLAADADTDTATGAAATSGGNGASVDLNFSIVIPEFIFFRVGSTLATVDTIEFQPSEGDVQAGTADTAATLASGDLGNGTVTVSLVSNAGGISITEENDGGGSGLSNGSGDFISYAQIDTLSNNVDLPAPTLSDTGGSSVNIAPTLGTDVTIRTAQWTYNYDNPATPPASGTYTGVVTYVAAVP